METNRVKSLANALDILMRMPEDRSISVSQLSKEMSMSKSAVWKILETFSDYGFVLQDEQTKEYSLGPTLISKGSKLLHSMDIRKLVSPYLHELTKKYNENSMLMVRQGDEALIVDYCEANVPIRLSMQMGQRHALYYGAAPKILLAYQSHDEQERIIQRINFKKYTTATIESAEKLRNAIAIIKANGFCYSGGEFGADGIGVAVPLWNGNMEIVGSIAMNVPSFRLEATPLNEIIIEMKRTAVNFSESLGADKNSILALINMKKTLFVDEILNKR